MFLRIGEAILRIDARGFVYRHKVFCV